VLAVKLALILTVMDWADEGGKDSPRITEAHWARAQMLSEEYRASAHRLLAELSVSQDVKNEQKVLDFIARAQATKPPTKREIHRGTGIKNRKDAHAAVDALVESGAIVEVERRSNGAGRPAKAYKLAEE
jgi:predicted transcriptional regulator